MRTRRPNSTRVIAGAIMAFAVAVLGVFGCNKILGNVPGVLFDASTPSSTLTCDPGKKACAGICSLTSDPAVGCSGACSICATPANAVAGCTLEDGSYYCGIMSCNDQYADCNNQSADGCETHTTTKENCGSCNQACTQKFCEHIGNGYDCSDTCTAPNVECTAEAGVECTDPKTDNDNCGGCGTACAVPNGSGFCDAGACESQCNATYFLCNGACGVATASQCGASCASCPNGTVCDTTTTDTAYGTCVSSHCVQSDSTCGPLCATDCTSTGDTCVNGSCTTNGCVAGECAVDGGGCTDDLTTDDNCGFCGNSCDPSDTSTCCCPPGGAVHIGLPFGGPDGVYTCRGNYDGTDCACPN